MPSVDIDAALRWFRFDRRGPLRRRDDRELPFVEPDLGAGQPLLLDTCVYIDQLQGKTPRLLDDLFRTRQLFHSMIAIKEMVHAIGALDPQDRRTAGVTKQISGLIREMPQHRILRPEPDTAVKSALLAGLLCRLQGYPTGRRLKALGDCILFMQAQKQGLIVLTRNIADFDLLLQLRPTHRVLLYRVAS